MTGAAPAITVVIPTYNSTATIGRALASIEAPPGGAEILLIDDRSSDLPALRQIVATHPQARLIEKPARTNAADSRAIGLAAARADIVFFLDSDDRYAAGHVARRLAMFAASGCGVIFGRFCLDDGTTTREHLIPPFTGQDIARYIFIEGGDCRSSTLAVDRRRLNGTTFDADLAQHQDWGFAMAMQRNGETIAFDPDPGVIIDVARARRMSGRVRVDASLTFLDRYLPLGPARLGFLLGRIKAAAKLGDRSAAWRFHTLLRRERPTPRQQGVALALVAMATLGVGPMLRRVSGWRRRGRVADRHPA